MSFQPTRVIVHCSASANGRAYPLGSLARDHCFRGFGDKDGVIEYTDIGYHFVIQPNGEIHSCRPLESRGAHCAGENYDSVGVCLVGTDQFTRQQFSSLRGVLSALRGRFAVELDQVYGHREFDSAKRQGKTCPGIDPVDLRRWLLERDGRIIEPYLFGGA